MAKKYYTLFCQETDGQWYPQFGDYSRAVVAQEALDSYAVEYAAARRKIVRHLDTLVSLNAQQRKLNGGEC